MNVLLGSPYRCRSSPSLSRRIHVPPPLLRDLFSRTELSGFFLNLLIILLRFLSNRPRDRYHESSSPASKRLSGSSLPSLGKGSPKHFEYISIPRSYRFFLPPIRCPIFVVAGVHVSTYVVVIFSSRYYTLCIIRLAYSSSLYKETRKELSTSILLKCLRENSRRRNGVYIYIYVDERLTFRPGLLGRVSSSLLPRAMKEPRWKKRGRPPRRCQGRPREERSEREGGSQ